MNEHTLETIGLELARLIRRATAITTNNAIGNLDRSAYLLLQQIASQGSTGVKALSEEFHLDISTVSRQAAALEQKGYVHRIPDSLDRRAYFLQITDLGTKELTDNINARKTMLAELLKNWSDEEVEMFGQLMKKFNRTINE